MKTSSTSATKVIRIQVADDHPVVREDELAPDVLLLDFRMPQKDGAQVVTELMSCGEPEPRIIVMTTFGYDSEIREGHKGRR